MNAPATGQEPHRGTLILILGILGIVICFPCGIAAWIMGNGDLKKIAAGTMDPEGQSLTNVGKILGIISVVLLVLGLIAGVAMTVLGFGAAAAAAAAESAQ